MSPRRRPSMSPRRRPRGLCIRVRGTPTSRNPLPQTGGVCTTVPGRRRSWARYQPATRCGGFVVPPLLRDVPQQRGDEQWFCCDDFGSLRDGGVGGVVGSS